MTKRAAVVTALALTLTVSIAACGSDEASAPNAEAGSATPSASASPGTEPTSTNGNDDEGGTPSSSQPSTNGDAGATAGARPTPPATTANQDRVQLTLRVANCAGCTFTAFTTTRGNTRNLGARTVASSRASWALTPAQTSGLAFTITTPDGEGVGNARAVVAWQYAGVTAGSTVTSAQAARADRGTWCWSGTSKATVSIPVTVERFRETAQGRRTTSLRIYANPMVSGQAPFVETSRGALGVQDDPPCPS